MTPVWIDLIYLLAAVLFISGLKGLTKPRTAVRGNQLGAIAMLLAVIATLLSQNFSISLILLGIVIGSGIGAVLATRVQMTEMPELVALFNGLGGAASVLVAGAFLVSVNRSLVASSEMTAAALSGLIGAVTFSGSFVAFGKLHGLKMIKDIRFNGQQMANFGLMLICLILGLLVVMHSSWASYYYWTMAIFALTLGYLMVISIGGADMPVVISLLNSFSGLAAAATGFALGNTVLIIAGSLVGASGLILTKIMCVAMNRSLGHVLFGVLQPSEATASADEVYVNVKSTSAEEVAMLLEVATKVAIIPGYGMAVAQAQHAVRDLTNQLLERDIDVNFGIHPVAGRMPGHMNVLLAEADIDYARLKEMDDINSEMDQVDIAIVLGANDVVNPEARTNPESPIAGMPIIDVDKARTVIVIKRSLSPGFAGIPNPLFSADNTLMFYGDGKDAIQAISKALDEG